MVISEIEVNVCERYSLTKFVRQKTGAHLKYITLCLLILVSVSCTAQSSKDTKQVTKQDTQAMMAVKQDAKVAAFLKEASKSASNTVTYHQMPLGSFCGFSGCEIRKLVNVLVTSNQSNAASKSMLAKVSYMEFSEKAPEVTIVTLSK